MKFAEYLAENEVDEWRRAYIKYRGLKKLVKRVDAHYRARMEREHPTALSKFQEPARQQAAELLRRGTRSLFSRGRADVPNYGSTSAPGGDIPPVSLSGTGLHLAGGGDDEDTDIENPAASTSSLPRAGPAEAAPGPVRTAHSGASAANLDAPPANFGAPPADAREIPAEQVRIPKDAHVRPPQSVSAEWVVPTEQHIPIDEIIARTFDAQETKFFLALDYEVTRIVHFYEVREHEAIDRLSMLVVQLTELAEHRREYKTQALHALSGQQSGLSRILSMVPRGLEADELRRVRLNAQNLMREPPAERDTEAGDKRRAEAIKHLHNMSIDEAIPPEADGRHAHATRHNPVRYRAARRKLKKAVLENYRALEILNNYRILNRTGFMKILKKFDKMLDVHTMHAYYDTRIMPTPLVASDAVPKMLTSLEEIFASYFEHGNKKRAQQILQTQHSAPAVARLRGHHGSVFRTGMYLGVALCATIEGLRSALSPATQALLPAWRQLLQLYGAAFIPVLFALIFGLNLVGWQAVRINTVFIFEWNASNALEPSQYFELPALFLLMLAICFWISFAAPAATAIAPTTWPLVWLVVVLVLLLNPFPVLYRSSRGWLIMSLLRVMTGGVLFSVEFRDFFLGDELNSLMYTFGNFWFLGCEYHHRWSALDGCSMARSWWIPVLTVIPPLLRLTQCLRRYYDSNCMVRIHLVNAGKYATSILNPFFLFNFRHHGSKGHVDLVLWCLFATINSVFTCSWDLTMDWNLLQPNAKYPLLRSQLAYQSVWPMYYVAMITNVMVRFIWVIYLFGGPASTQLRSFLAALLEMLRRWQWNFIRLENEHLGNADSFKIVRDMPLPYPVPRQAAADSDDDDDDTKTLDLRPFAMRSGGTEDQEDEEQQRARESLVRTQAGLKAARTTELEEQEE
ncbi:Xenotropic and polytropic retrovirus receptor 1 [Malassezia sp. CBS 17886]|nr:Xenotropic and polytropic retrovirus receptor 1 [Malassezia sp. CBS 17886]